VGITDDLDKFTLRIIDLPDEDDEKISESNFIQHLRIDYKIDWPLHLLFSPTVLDRYNTIFRFLLVIKKIQNNLHAVWADQIISHREQSKIHNRVVQLRNSLMFFVDNLQYYIQSDVLDSK